MTFSLPRAKVSLLPREASKNCNEKDELFSQIAIALLVMGLVSALPLVKARIAVSMEDVEAMQLSSDFETNGAYPHRQTFTDFVNEYVAFD